MVIMEDSQLGLLEIHGGLERLLLAADDGLHAIHDLPLTCAFLAIAAGLELLEHLGGQVFAAVVVLGVSNVEC